MVEEEEEWEEVTPVWLHSVHNIPTCFFSHLDIITCCYKFDLFTGLKGAQDSSQNYSQTYTMFEKDYQLAFDSN